ncbi:MAG: DNA repair protein RadC [Pseudomonadota bacterium]|nr:DNA repair protein RadC [Pseudomonadota bacterium]
MKPFRAVRHRKAYTIDGCVSREEIVAFALKLVARRFKRGANLTSSDATRDFLRLKLANYEHEVFCALFLDSQHKLVAYEELFQGTIDGCAVYPREVVKKALSINAAAIIFAHNHPSGHPEPSQADIDITRRLVRALTAVDIRVLDHCVVGGDEVVSFAERGLV